MNGGKDGGYGGYGGRMSEEMSERTANIAEFKAMKDDSKPFLGNGGSVGKHDTYPPYIKLYPSEEAFCSSFWPQLKQ
jgi:hypothetical protein